MLDTNQIKKELTKEKSDKEAIKKKLNQNEEKIVELQT